MLTPGCTHSGTPALAHPSPAQPQPRRGEKPSPHSPAGLSFCSSLPHLHTHTNSQLGNSLDFPEGQPTRTGSAVLPQPWPGCFSVNHSQGVAALPQEDHPDELSNPPSMRGPWTSEPVEAMLALCSFAGSLKGFPCPGLGKQQDPSENSLWEDRYLLCEQETKSSGWEGRERGALSSITLGVLRVSTC